MAVVTAEAALSSLLPKLSQLLVDEYNLQRGVRSGIELMLKELESVRARLFEFQVQADEQFKLWAEDLKELVLRLESLVDKTAHSMRTAASSEGLKARISIVSKMKTQKALRQFVREFDDIRWHLFAELQERRGRYQIDSSILPTRQNRHLQAPDVNDSPDGSEKEEITAEAAKLVAQLAKDAGEVYKFPSKVKGGICFLQKELEYIQVALRMIAKMPTDEVDEGTKAWEEDLKDFSRDVKDAVDNFITSKARRKFSSDICDLKQEILEVGERRRRYNKGALTEAWRRSRRFNNSDDSPSDSIGPRLPPDPLPDPGSLVGIDRPRDALVKFLNDEGSTSKSNQQVKTVSIVGLAGVGKTALAKAVYDSIASKFDRTAWVTLSRNPDMKMVLAELLRQLIHQEEQSSCQDDQPERTERLDVRQLIDVIRHSLEDKRYLVVIDDIWSIEEWKMLRCALIKNSNGSTVWTTTCISNVAEQAGQVCRLLPLSETYSRKLFYARLFGSEDKCPSELADISTKLIAKCRGIPLALVSTADLLGMKPQTVESWQLVNDSVGFEQGQSNLRSILEPSYYDLPRHLKLCLLYLSMFQRGYKISGDRLVWAWIAEGFIQGFVTSPDQVGEMYLDELINRNLIESKEDDSGRKAYCVHDLVHDLIISLSTEEKFATILDGQQSRSLPDTVRLSIHGNSVEHLPPQVPVSRLRSLVVTGDAKVPSLSNLHDLRILDLGGCGSLQNDHLKGIEKSVLLRYLVIGGNCITSIPNEISSLIWLQTLDLRASGLKEMPECVLKCVMLECLCVNGNTKIPDGIGKMKALQELGDINISKPELLKELSNLINLRVLKICLWSWDESYHDALLEYLCSLVKNSQPNIRSLHIFTCCSLDFMSRLEAESAPQSLEKLEIRYSAFLALPSWILLLQNLLSLSIEVHMLSQDIIDFLGKLHKLRSLSLISKYAPEGMFGTGTHRFENLTNFYFVSNTMPKVFGPDREVMHRLKELKLSFHASQTEDANEGFNFGLEDLCSLEQVTIEIICFDASRPTVERAEAAIRQAIFSGQHPNLEIRRVKEKYMTESEVTPNIQPVANFLLVPAAADSQHAPAAQQPASTSTSTSSPAASKYQHQPSEQAQEQQKQAENNKTQL